MRFFQTLFTTLGRFAIAAIFVAAGAHKVLNWEATLDYMRSGGIVEHTEQLLIAAASVELIGGLAFAFGFFPRLFGVILALFLIPTTYTFHNFWAMTDATAFDMQLTQFLKNLAIFGGLLCFVFAPGAPAKAAPSEKK
ncbi:MAG TPA: DoxX family protein [Chlamydiales bacterium]|nr:DoxX family protein [Chlamydiales bacterium]